MQNTVVLLGTQFPYRPFYPSEAKIIQVDINAGSLGSHCHIDMGLIGDIKATLDALQPHLEAKQDTKHLDGALKHYAEARRVR